MAATKKRQINCTNAPKYKMSGIDRLFNQLFNTYPKKRGRSLELITASVFHMVTKQEVIYDIQKRNFGKSNYQIDGLIDNKTGIEVKDYKNNVGRGYLQKFHDTLNDVESLTNGFFVTSSSYTNESKTYAKERGLKEGDKKINLYVARPAKKEDLIGRTLGYKLNFCSKIPNHIYFPITENDEYIFPIVCYYGGQYPLYDDKGNLISELTQELIKNFGDEVKTERDYFAFKCKIENYNIKGFKFDTFYDIEEKSEVIKPQGNPVLLFKGLGKNDINTLFTDAQLKESLLEVLDYNNMEFSI